jgi:hypothetical protein
VPHFYTPPPPPCFSCICSLAIPGRFVVSSVGTYNIILSADIEIIARGSGTAGICHRVLTYIVFCQPSLTFYHSSGRSDQWPPAFEDQWSINSRRVLNSYYNVVHIMLLCPLLQNNSAFAVHRNNSRNDNRCVLVCNYSISTLYNISVWFTKNSCTQIFCSFLGWTQTS